MSVTFDPRPFNLATFNTIQSQLDWIGFDGTIPASLEDRLELTQRDLIVREHLEARSAAYWSSRDNIVGLQYPLFYHPAYFDYIWREHGGWWLMNELLRWKKLIDSFGNNEAVQEAFKKRNDSGALSRMALKSAQKAEVKVRSLRLTTLWTPWEGELDLRRGNTRIREEAMRCSPEEGPAEGGGEKESY